MPNKWVFEIQMNRDNKNLLSISKDEKKMIPLSLVNRALEELANRASAGARKQLKNNLDMLCESLLKIDQKTTFRTQVDQAP